MKDFLLEHQDTILKVLGIGLIIFIVNKIANIWRGPDGKFNTKEFCEFVGVVFFLTAGGFMLWHESQREHEWHVFDATYIFIVFGALLSILQLEKTLDKVIQIMRLILEMRMNKVAAATPPPPASQPETPEIKL
jgi:drug/metabolite transporter (DMT)-like permease